MDRRDNLANIRPIEHKYDNAHIGIGVRLNLPANAPKPSIMYSLSALFCKVNFALFWGKVNSTRSAPQVVKSNKMTKQSYFLSLLSRFN